MQFNATLRKSAELIIGMTAIITLILAGCGGSGGSSGSVATTSASIVPFKGSFSSGIVSIKDANGNAVTIISGGTLNASGVADVTFNANVSYPLTVEITGSYYNEVTQTTETSTIPLRSLITSGSSTVPVNIVTELAVADLLNRIGTVSTNSPITPVSAVAALNVAGSMLGIPASAVPAFNPSTHKISDANTLRLAALGVVANSESGATLLGKVVSLADRLAKLNSSSAPTSIVNQANYNMALTAMTSGASSVMEAGAIAPAASTISTSSYSLLYASAVAAAQESFKYPRPTIGWSVSPTPSIYSWVMQICYGSNQCTPLGGVILMDVNPSDTTTVTGTANGIAFDGLTSDELQQIINNGTVALNDIIGNLWKGTTVPGSAVIESVFNTALASATSVPDLMDRIKSGFTAAGYPAAAGATIDNTTVATNCISQPYAGGANDPQVDTLCKTAQFDACVHAATGSTATDIDGRAQCTTLSGILQSTASSWSCQYCPYPY